MAGNQVIVGNSFSDITSVTGASSVTTKDNVFYNVNDPAYCFNYNVQIIPYDYANKITSAAPIKMKIVSVIKDEIIDSSISDRIILEADIKDNDVFSKYSSFEIQIAWQSNKDIDKMKLNHDLIGKICDMSISLDKAFSAI